MIESRCSHPTHSERKDHPLYQDVVSVGEVVIDAFICGACAEHELEQEAKRQALTAPETTPSTMVHNP